MNILKADPLQNDIIVFKQDLVSGLKTVLRIDFAKSRPQDANVASC